MAMNNQQNQNSRINDDQLINSRRREIQEELAELRITNGNGSQQRKEWFESLRNRNSESFTREQGVSTDNNNNDDDENVEGHRQTLVTTSSSGNSNQTYSQTTLTITNGTSAYYDVSGSIENASTSGTSNATAAANLSRFDEEMNLLLQSQRVSTVLSDERFRSTLENRLRNSLSSLSTQNSNTDRNVNSNVEPIPVEDILSPTRDPEIQALLNYQIVSNIMHGAFRNHLESTLWSRYVSRRETQMPIQPSEEYPQPSSSNRISSNDFGVIYTLRNDVSQLRNMMQVLIQSQIETQRYIRQEVTGVLQSLAAVGTSGAETPTNQVIIPTPTNTVCCICLIGYADTMIYRCGHLCLCYPCSTQLRIQTPNSAIICPICRTPAQDVIRVFTSSQSNDNQ